MPSSGVELWRGGVLHKPYTTGSIGEYIGYGFAQRMIGFAIVADKPDEKERAMVIFGLVNDGGARLSRLHYLRDGFASYAIRNLHCGAKELVGALGFVSEYSFQR